MIFDIKMDGLFTQKARFVAGGHTTDTPASITYLSVVSHDSVLTAFKLVDMNGLKIKAADIGNAYLNAECREANDACRSPRAVAGNCQVILLRRLVKQREQTDIVTLSSFQTVAVI